MKIRNIAFVLVFFLLLFVCTGCATGVSMPYSSNEYKELDWSVEELVAHFEELGFSDIKTDVWETFDENQARICRVAIEDTSADSWFTEYKDFDKDEEFGTHLEIYISAYTLVPTLTVDNCAEFAELVTMDSENPEKPESLASFMQTHDGDYLEFDGIITDWYDELWFAGGVSFTISVEGSDQMSFSWETMGLIDLDMTGEYHYNNYNTGLITEGMKVHVLAKIDYVEGSWSLEIDSMQIID